MGARGIPPPPRWARKTLYAAWPAVGFVLSGLGAPVVVTGAFLAGVDKKAKLFRVSSLATMLLWVDITMLVKCWRLQAASPDGASPTWRRDHERVFVDALDTGMHLAQRWVGLEVRLADRMHFGAHDAPLIALARHAGPGDSVAIPWVLARTAGRLPRIVLAEALRWDPGVNTIVTSLGGFFVPAQSGPNGDRLDGVRRLAASLHPDDVLLLFPEGENWTPTRRSKIITKLRERGERLRAARAESLRYVLPPKSRGAWAAHEARPDADIMIVAHVGLGMLTSPKLVFDAVPFQNRPLEIKTWTYAAADVPDEEVAFTAWLEDRWVEVDAWIAEQKSEQGS